MEEQNRIITSKDGLVDFADENKKTKPEIVETWKLLIVDDEREVHTITKLVLKDLVYDNKKIEFLNAYSGDEAKKILKADPGIAVILLDVVMEEENSGLKVAEFIRKDLKNKEVRIILRTGYPGQAPERRIIVDYDINDYKEKTELSSQKLQTTIITALRSYKDLKELSRLNKDLEGLVHERTKELSEINSRLNESLTKIEKDLFAGKQLQTKLLPKSHGLLNGFKIDCYIKPSLYLSGDFYDYFEIDKNHLGFYFVDVSGHGASSAFVTILIKKIFDEYKMKFTLGETKEFLRPHVVLKRINDELLDSKLDKYATVFFGIISTDEKKLYYSNGGQFPFPVVLSKNGHKKTIDTSGIPVGLFDFAEFKSNTLDLEDFFKLILFSDGILEIIDEEELSDKVSFLHSILETKTELESVICEFDLKNRDYIPDDITSMMISYGVSDE